MPLGFGELQFFSQEITSKLNEGKKLPFFYAAWNPNLKKVVDATGKNKKFKSILCTE